MDSGKGLSRPVEAEREDEGSARTGRGESMVAKVRDCEVLNARRNSHQAKR
jgi:hypothetical protein